MVQWKLQPPQMVQEAAKTGGKNVAIEILMFIAVFLVNFIITFILMVLVGTIAGIAGGISGKTPEQLTAILMGPNVLAVMSLYSTVVAVAVGILFCLWIQKRRPSTLGFVKKDMWKEYGIGLLAGFLMMSAVVGAAVLTGTMKLSLHTVTGSDIAWMLAIFAGFLIQGMSEEILCRGYFMVSLARKKGNIWMAIIVSALAFALLHVLNPGFGLLPFLNLFLFGVFAGVYFVKRGNIWGIGAIHSVWNFAQGNLYGVPVSGTNAGASIWTAESSEAAALWNGGSFGVEGGLFVTILLLAATFGMLCTKQKNAAQLG